MSKEYPKTAIEFKRECRKYFYYLADVKNQMMYIRQVDQQMTGVHSIDFTRVRTARSSGNDAKLINFIELNTELNRQLQEKEEKLVYIINTINRIENPGFRPIIWMLYVQGMRISEVAALYDMSKDYLSQLVNDEIHKLFPKEKKPEKEPAE